MSIKVPSIITSEVGVKASNLWRRPRPLVGPRPFSDRVTLTQVKTKSPTQDSDLPLSMFNNFTCTL